MTQGKVLDWLEEQYGLNPDRFFSRREICEGIKLLKANPGRKRIGAKQYRPLKQLTKYGLLRRKKDVRETGGSYWVYRFIPEDLRFCLV